MGSGTSFCCALSAIARDAQLKRQGDGLQLATWSLPRDTAGRTDYYSNSVGRAAGGDVQANTSPRKVHTKGGHLPLWLSIYQKTAAKLKNEAPSERFRLVLAVGVWRPFFAFIAASLPSATLSKKSSEIYMQRALLLQLSSFGSSTKVR